MLRCFEDGDVTHVAGTVDPVRDAEIVETELMLADLDSLEKRLPNLEKRAKGGDKEAAAEAPVVKKALDALREGKPAREAAITAEERPVFAPPAALTAKPVIYVLNVDEGSAATGNAAQRQGRRLCQGSAACRLVVISAAIEAEVAQLPRRGPGRVSRLARPEGDRPRPRGARRLRAARPRDLLHRRPEGGARLDGAPRGAKAPEAAGVIHTDFEKGFIRAETIAYDDYVALNGEAGAREAGKLRLEGKDYVVKDGDVFHFRFNV